MLLVRAKNLSHPMYESVPYDASLRICLFIRETQTDI